MRAKTQLYQESIEKEPEFRESQSYMMESKHAFPSAPGGRPNV